MYSLKEHTLKNFPVLGQYKRYLLAFATSLAPARVSYSQYGEDLHLSERLKSYDFSESIYVDVGSNHPTSISNTYLLYRNGCCGIAIEPNLELAQLHKKVRPRDIVLNIGCGNQSFVGQLKIGKAPVLSYISNRHLATNHSDQLGFEYWRTEYVPVLPLDLALSQIDYKWIFLLSIDVEGLDFEVLEGAVNTLSQVLFCCVEANSDAEAAKIDDFLTHAGFAFDRKIGCNLIFKNQSAWFNQFLID